jgi:hypothetical protein
MLPNQQDTNSLSTARPLQPTKKNDKQYSENQAQ